MPPLNSNLIQVEAGCTFSMCVSSEGEIFSWGDSGFGQLGHGDKLNRYSPVMIAAISRVTKVSAGRTHSVCVTTGSDLFCWGDSREGKLGLGEAHQISPCKTIPKIVSSLHGLIPIQVAAGHRHTVCLMQDGRVFAWGCGVSGQLGTGTCDQQNYPTELLYTSEWQIMHVSAGANHTLCATNRGKILGCGEWRMGSLGYMGDNTDSSYVVSTLQEVAPGFF